MRRLARYGREDYFMQTIITCTCLMQRTTSSDEVCEVWGGIVVKRMASIVSRRIFGLCSELRNRVADRADMVVGVFHHADEVVKFQVSL